MQRQNTQKNRAFHRASRSVASTVLAVALCGCASLDPTDDIQSASTHVMNRTAIETGWDAPWDEVSDAWDGQTPLAADAAVRMALQNNRAIRRQVEEIVASRSDFVQAHLLPNPVINVSIGFPTDGMGGEPMMGSVVQQLAALWRRPDAIDEADAQLQAAVLSVSDAALSLVAQVRQAHARVVFGEQAVALQEANIELLTQTVELLEQRQDVGEASQLDVNRVALESYTAQVRLADRQSQLDQARRELLQLIGRSDASADWVTDGTVQIAGNVTTDHDEQWYFELAEAQRLDIAAANAQLDAQGARVSYEQTGQWPDVRGGIRYEENLEGRSSVFPTVGVTAPIFDDNSARIARAESAYRQATIEADRVRQQAITEARTAWVDARSQLHVVASFENEIVALAQTNHRLAEQAFEAGEADLTVLLEAQRQLNDARIELSDRQAAAARSVIELERAVGGSLTPVMSEPISEKTDDPEEASS